LAGSTVDFRSFVSFDRQSAARTGYLRQGDAAPTLCKFRANSAGFENSFFANVMADSAKAGGQLGPPKVYALHKLRAGDRRVGRHGAAHTKRHRQQAWRRRGLAQ